MIEFIGRLHPLIVHLPIGILLLATAFNFLSRFKKFKSIKGAGNASLLLGSLAALAACVSGLVLADQSYEAHLISIHKYFALATTFLSLLLLWVVNSPLMFKEKQYRRKVNSSLYLILIIFIFVTGHYGGSLTHGEGYLFPESSSTIPTASARSFEINASVYDQLIQPLLQEKCYQCHSSKKQKGKLRLDSKEFILKGGKDGPILNSINTQQSDILQRIHLPIEEEDHMPPSDNDQLTSSELDLITTWVEEGASFSATLHTYTDTVVILNYIQSKYSSKENKWWPMDNVDEADPKVINQLIQSGVTVEPLSDKSNYLQLSFISLDTLSTQIWEDAQAIKEQIISARFSGILLSGSEINNIAQWIRIRKLFLEGSLTEHSDITPLSKLKELRYLNILNDSLLDAQLNVLLELKSLEKIYVHGSKISEAGLKKLQSGLPDCRIEFAPASLPKLASDTLIYRKK